MLQSNLRSFDLDYEKWITAIDQYWWLSIMLCTLVTELKFWAAEWMALSWIISSERGSVAVWIIVSLGPCFSGPPAFSSTQWSRLTHEVWEVQNADSTAIEWNTGAFSTLPQCSHCQPFHFMFISEPVWSEEQTQSIKPSLGQPAFCPSYTRQQYKPWTSMGHQPRKVLPLCKWTLNFCI